MKKQISILIPLIAIGVVLAVGYKGFGWENNFRNTDFSKLITPFAPADPLALEAWTTFEKYLEFVHAHDLIGVKSLSYQTSETCNDPAKETECFALMDNLYNIASYLEQDTFTHIASDERQIIMYTDGPTVVILYFVREADGAPKVLGLRLCLEDETSRGTCVETDPMLRDKDGNGWWDSVESLFYK